MDRHRLDTLTARHALGAEAIAAALRLTGLRPDAEAWRRFVATVLRAAGLGALGAGALFFIAANWQDYGLIGRFALLQGMLLACIAVALWKPPPAWHGQAALILATLLTGGLLALHGQAYQTGADVYELFLAWALLALPFALAGLSGALWAVWWCVLNVGLVLFSGTLSERIAVALLFGRGIDMPSLLMAWCALNLLAAAAFVRLHSSRFARAAPLWLARSLATVGMAYGTLAVSIVVASARSEPDARAAATAPGFAAICAVIAWMTLKRRSDVFPLALVAAAWIAISTTWIGRRLRFDDIGSFFVIALWLIGVSTAAGWLLMRWVRAWGADTALAIEHASEGASA